MLPRYPTWQYTRRFFGRVELVHSLTQFINRDVLSARYVSGLLVVFYLRAVNLSL
ncbi:HSP20 family molecular chaperone IbpA [Paenibacillus phyllosphaerae]|uniref:HSP20 family molecular chaperone IbpA n=1 Tax=Paenibacillus phyllosphaerae TaxID=274593 RepID=A0A7W5FQX1_9BACL|nr:hypothetical protein [Paenibacillus phyllosphaerae]MBB3113459.1 HSP20 family molecular chaperone IbpA [Paenibacillus phyllosphaerae]